MTARTRTPVKGGVGESVVRPDGVPKLTGNFAYISDMAADQMLWGSTRRSPHAHARIRGLDTGPALAMPGVAAVITQNDVPGKPTFGQDVQDQPVLCDGTARFWGEPVAVVAADDPETARRAAAAMVVDWEPLEPVDDMEVAARQGETFRTIHVERGDKSASGTVVIEEHYQVGMQDQAPLGPEAGMAIPDGSGGIDLYATTQWVHVDHRQIIECLGAEPGEVRCHPGGIGGAFGAREDISLHIHLCLLARITGRPVKMVYNRSESFVGHVKRHPGRMWYRHEADHQGRLVKVECRLILDGGAYQHTSAAVIANAAFFAVGPYRCDNVVVDAATTRTNNPPAGAMRGFGVVQACFAHEAQMDKIASTVGLSPLEVRRINALEHGDLLNTTGQTIEGALPTTRVIDELERMPMAEYDPGDDPRLLPGGTGRTTDPGSVKRGVGYALSLKNLAFSEGFDDSAEARVVLTPAGVEVHTAAMEVGQGLVTVCQQIARSVLGISRVAVVWDNTSEIGSAGSTSASRQTQMTGGAVHAASVGLLEKILADHDGDELNDGGVYREGVLVAAIDRVCADGAVDHWVNFSHPPTCGVDENGQGAAHAGFAVAAHRAVVDVDEDLGLVRVVHIDTAQDVGRVLNPSAAIGQVEGGIMQGVGLAVMEEVIVDRGVIRNPTFTDYLLPTFLDAPSVEARFIEEPDHWGPYGAKGIGEPPTISSTPAVVAAIRDAIGHDLTRVPVRPEDIVGI